MKRVLKENDEKLAKMQCELLEMECKALKIHLEQKEVQEKNIMEQLHKISSEQKSLKSKHEEQEKTIMEHLNSISSRPSELSMGNDIEIKVVNGTDVKVEN